MMKEDGSIVLFVGTYPPRECGIATFTQDLSRAFEKKYAPKFRSKILAINNNGTNIYNYPKEVLYQISDADISDYIEAAKKINRNNQIKLVCIQHEFGIFKGEFGSYLISFLEILNKPVVVTFHSILPSPVPMMKRVVQSIAEKSDAIVVMAREGKKILRSRYGVRTDIRVIPHGIPDMELLPPERKKRALGLGGRTVLLSFGMMGPGKGYEYVIESLPKVVKKHPEVLFVIVGETHPVVRKQQGESYRNMLEAKIRELGLKKNVKFYNKYVALSEIVSYLEAADIFISSGLNPNQITSGTLAYAMGSGRPIISTPFLHAKEAIGRSGAHGLLVPFRSPKSFEKALLKVLSDGKLMRRMGKNNFRCSRKMLWPNVSEKYMQLFAAKTGAAKKRIDFPPIRLDHLSRMTRPFGMLQFSNGSVPDPASGYTLDDNARALLLCSRFCKLSPDRKVLFALARKYLSFIERSQQKDGRFLNIFGKDKAPERDSQSEDSFGRAVWALCSVAGNARFSASSRAKAKKVLAKAYPNIRRMRFLKAMAFVIIGLCEYEKKGPSNEGLRAIETLADRLVASYDKNSSGEWRWFEKFLTYCNGRLPEAMFRAYAATGNRRYFGIAKESLDFLVSVTFERGHFAPIGQEGWFFKDGKKAHFDQQPIDVTAMVGALLAAHQQTNDDRYLRNAFVAFQWFLGRNDIRYVVYDRRTGGCKDGIGHATPNYNEGAESTLAYLLSRVDMESVLSKETEKYLYE